MSKIVTYILEFETLNVHDSTKFKSEILTLLPEGKYASKGRPSIKYTLMQLLMNPNEYRIHKIVQNENILSLIYPETIKE